MHTHDNYFTRYRNITLLLQVGDSTAKVYARYGIVWARQFKGQASKLSDCPIAVGGTLLDTLGTILM